MLVPRTSVPVRRGRQYGNKTTSRFLGRDKQNKTDGGRLRLLTERIGESSNHLEQIMALPKSIGSR